MHISVMYMYMYIHINIYIYTPPPEVLYAYIYAYKISGGGVKCIILLQAALGCSLFLQCRQNL